MVFFLRSSNQVLQQQHWSTMRHVGRLIGRTLSLVLLRARLWLNLGIPLIAWRKQTRLRFSLVLFSLSAKLQKGSRLFLILMVLVVLSPILHQDWSMRDTLHVYLLLLVQIWTNVCSSYSASYRVWHHLCFCIGTLFTSRVTSLSTAEINADIIANFSPPLVNPTVLQDAATKLLELYPDIPALGSPFNTGNDTFGLPTGYKREAALVEFVISYYSLPFN